MQPISAQQEFDEAMESTKPKLASKREFQDLLKKSESSPSPVELLDPIAQAMKQNPGLTKEEAIKMAEAFGF